uniref:Uncharacterized protein n=1 Tax=Desulfovibrio sp. U5L TaxID=596152 RepID=I2Q065_9BACT
MSISPLQANANAALATIQVSMPAEAKALAAYVGAIVKKDIVVLGEDDAFALRDSSGQIKAFKQKLVLSEANGGLTRPVSSGPWVISAQGYEKWSEAAGANVIFPKTVIVDGVEQTNPHVVKDSSNGRVKGIYARAIAFRFSSKGLPMVRDWTTFYDVPGYRMIDLLAKAADKPQAFKLRPIEAGKPTDPGDWGSYAFDEVMALWVDSSHKDALSWYKNIINREKKAMDFAQTFACRNACKHLSGLQKAPANYWELAVICWRPMNGGLMKWDGTSYDSMLENVEALGSGQGQIALGAGEKPVTIEYAKGVDHMDAEPDLIGAEDEEAASEAEQAAPLDMTAGQNGTFDHEPAAAEASLAVETEPEPTLPAATPDPAPAGPVLSDADQKALANYEATREACPDEDARARRRMSIKPDAAVTPDQARELYRLIGNMVDGGAQ